MMTEAKPKPMIVLKLRSEDDLFNPYDPSGNRMCSDIYSYIKTCFEEISLVDRRNAIIVLQSEQSIDTETIKRLLVAAVNRELSSMEKALHINRAKMGRLYLIGIVLIAIGLALALSLDQIVLEVISIIGSMAVKDAATIQIEHNPDIKLKMRLLEQLKAVRILQHSVGCQDGTS